MQLPAHEAESSGWQQTLVQSTAVRMVPEYTPLPVNTATVALVKQSMMAKALNESATNDTDNRIFLIGF